MGGAARWWLHGSLEALSKGLAARGGKLILRRGASDKVIPDFIQESGARSISWNRCYEPAAVTRDTVVKTGLKAGGIEAESFNGALLFEPWELRTQSGSFFKVFTPFCRTGLKMPSPRTPIPAPGNLNGHKGSLASDTLESWGLRPTKPDWAGGLREAWTPGEEAALTRLTTFHEETISEYVEDRDTPGEAGTSRLSPYLAFGEISPHQVWHYAARQEPARGVTGFMRQIMWREFCAHLLYHAPKMPRTPLREEFASFPWRRDPSALAAWKHGQTGYPIVDAGMRELWHTGWMHNRVRMVTASFLVKHLLISWRSGEKWFWDTLVDADLANNAANWQWVAGCGTDAAPYFRIFNPVLQGEKFDAGGAYVRRWVPELKNLADAWLHKPWEAPHAELQAAGIVMGETYPLPIVDHKTARTRALFAFAQMRSG